MRVMVLIKADRHTEAGVMPTEQLLADMGRWLNNWVMQYVEPSPELASEEAKARRPLAAAEVVVEEVPDNPGYYGAKFFLRPHYQLEGLDGGCRELLAVAGKTQVGQHAASDARMQRLDAAVEHLG